jgi:hypothetical protein
MACPEGKLTVPWKFGSWVAASRLFSLHRTQFDRTGQERGQLFPYVSGDCREEWFHTGASAASGSGAHHLCFDMHDLGGLTAHL